jgi:hypothetical protein
MPLHDIAWSRALAEWGRVFDEQLFYSWGGTPAAEIISLLNEAQGLSMPARAKATGPAASTPAATAAEAGGQDPARVAELLVRDRRDPGLVGVADHRPVSSEGVRAPGLVRPSPVSERPANRFDHTNLVDELDAHRISWGAYMDALPASDPLADFWPSSTDPLYASKHDPFALYRGAMGEVAGRVQVFCASP